MSVSDPSDSPLPAAPGTSGGRPLAVALLLLAAAALCGHSLLFNFVTDDAFISFVYSRNLAQHGQLVFNLGERVEGYTNFLWTVILALGLRLQIPPELSSRVLGTACACATLLCAAALSRDLRRGDALRPGDALPALILAGVPGYACWASGGLETQLFTLLLTAGAAAYLRDLHRGGADPAAALRGQSGALFGLAALTRPEGLLFFALTGLHLILLRLRALRGLAALRPTRALWRFTLAFLLLVVPHLLWRRAYYGYWVPNTFYVKSAGLPGTWGQGAYYLGLFVAQTKLVLLPLLALAALLWARGAQAKDPFARACGYVFLLSGVFLLYVASVGGDFMGLHRFLLPIVPLNVVLGSVALLRLCARAGSPALTAGAVALLLGLHGLNTARVDQRALTFLGADRGIDTPGYLRHYTADRAAIGKWLGKNVRPDDYQVVGGAGAQVYYAGIRALDSFGLCDAYVAHKVPARDTRPGHQKFAPLDYVLSQKPTLLTYNVYKIADAPYHPDAGEAAYWHRLGFHYVSAQIPGLSRPWYSFLKRTDRALGPFPALDTTH